MPLVTVCYLFCSLKVCNLPEHLEEKQHSVYQYIYSTDKMIIQGYTCLETKQNLQITWLFVSKSLKGIRFN